MIVSKVVQKIDSYNYKCMESVPCLYSNISLWWYLNTYVAFTICICIFWRKRIYTPYFLQLTHELNFISLKLAVQVLLNPSKPPTKVLLGISTYIHIQLLFTPFQNLNNICLEVFILNGLFQLELGWTFTGKAEWHIFCWSPEHFPEESLHF